MRILHDLRVALGFLTRVPVGDVSGGDPTTVRLAPAVPWFPLVGAGVGLVVAGAWRGLIEVLPPFVAAAIAVAIGLLLTGAFHHDGLADMADAFGGGWTVEQRFEILKDSRLGTYGTAALVVALMIEVATLGSFDAGDGFWAIAVAHGFGRAVAVLTMLVAPVAGDGLGASYMHELSTLACLLGVAAVVVPAAFVSPVLVVWPAIAAVLAGALVIGLSVRKIAGVTGDVLGAIAVLAALASLVTTLGVI